MTRINRRLFVNLRIAKKKQPGLINESGLSDHLKNYFFIVLTASADRKRFLDRFTSGSRPVI